MSTNNKDCCLLYKTEPLKNHFLLKNEKYKL